MDTSPAPKLPEIAPGAAAATRGRPLGWGIDGAKGGWAWVRWQAGHGPVAVGLSPTLAAIPWAEAVAGWRLVDIPLGLPPGGPRACDALAQAQLGPGRRASVFAAPGRLALAAGDHAQAVAALRAAGWPGISIQAWHLGPKIREADAWYRALPPAEVALTTEAHPELAFAALAGAPVAEPKRTAAGRERRFALLATVASAVALDRLRARLPGAAPDDVLDAAVLAWAATTTLGWWPAPPTEAPRDACGVPMAIAYPLPFPRASVSPG